MFTRSSPTATSRVRSYLLISHSKGSTSILPDSANGNSHSRARSYGLRGSFDTLSEDRQRTWVTVLSLTCPSFFAMAETWCTIDLRQHTIVYEGEHDRLIIQPNSGVPNLTWSGQWHAKKTQRHQWITGRSYELGVFSPERLVMFLFLKAGWIKLPSW
ncbi:hypothetical protein BDR05DRAFT_801665 [Suillus weaverae]|nr:hypothetical protein BDR05DRAFT_801665 [Suillus weaverae]